MKTLTTSQLVQALIAKGYNTRHVYYIPDNKWGADSFSFIEQDNGKSYIQLDKTTSKDSSRVVASYSKMKAADKKELASLILA